MENKKIAEKVKAFILDDINPELKINDMELLDIVSGMSGSELCQLTEMLATISGFIYAIKQQ